MRKYLKILFGLFRLAIEKLLNGGHLKLHGISYCINTGVKIWTYNHGTCDLGKKTWISENCIFECGGGKLKLGYNNFFNTNCRIATLENIEIGDNNLFGQNVTIVDHDHRFDKNDELICKQGFVCEPINIGSNVWIGANTTICKGVTIADKVIIGANSVVTKDCTQSGIYVGCPAKKIKDL